MFHSTSPELKYKQDISNNIRTLLKIFRFLVIPRVGATSKFSTKLNANSRRYQSFSLSPFPSLNDWIELPWAFLFPCTTTIVSGKMRIAVQSSTTFAKFWAEKSDGRDTWRRGTRDLGIINGSDFVNGRFRVFQFRGVECVLTSFLLDIPIVKTMEPSLSLSLSSFSCVKGNGCNVSWYEITATISPPRYRASYNIIHSFRGIKCKFSLYRYFRTVDRRFYVLCTIILLFRAYYRWTTTHSSNMHCKNVPVDGQSKS